MKQERKNTRIVARIIRVVEKAWFSPLLHFADTQSAQRSPWAGFTNAHTAPSRKFGFTLAEVLITLGIIGVVAAMTLPALIANYQDRQFRVAYKKAYSDASNAFSFLVAEDAYVIPKDETPIDSPNYGDTCFSPEFGEYFKRLGEKIKVIKTCYNNDAGNCFVTSGECAQNGVCTSASYAFVDASGRQWYMYNNKESVFIIDTNGAKNPNQLGKDRFPFRFPIKSGKIVLNYSFMNFKNYADVELDTSGDMTTKQRWCPSGECYWTTWLLD